MGLLALAMMVKNEADTIKKTIDSVYSYVDRFIFLDTGSTDSTKEEVTKAVKDKKLDWFEEPFVDFATSRNRLITLAGKEDTFLLLLDADDVLHKGYILRDFCEKFQDKPGDCYNLNMVMGNTSWYYPRLIRAGSNAHYVGKVHELLTGVEYSGNIPEVLIVHNPNQAGLDKTKARFERDLALLESSIRENPQEPRSVFYYAQTLECLGRQEEAYQFYDQRSLMPNGFKEEIFESLLRMAKLSVSLKMEWPKIQQHFLNAHEFFPHRAEPLFYLALLNYQKGLLGISYMYALACTHLPYPKTDVLFVEADVYAYRAKLLLAKTGRPFLNVPAKAQIAKWAAEQAYQFLPKNPEVIDEYKFWEST